MKNTEQEVATGLTQSAFNRRAFVKGAGFTGLGLAGATLAAGKLGMMDSLPGARALGIKPSSVLAAGVTDVDILNFALNLEYLEAEFYTMALTGKTIEDYGIGIDGTGTQGPTTGGMKVDFDNRHERSRKLNEIATEIAYDEAQHVILLRGALGGAAVAKPAINLDALGIGFANFRQFLQLSRAFEDTGVSAYGGAAPLITSKAYLQTAVQIALTEAYHASNVRLLISENDVATTATDSMDILPPPSGVQYFTVNLQALAVVRTTSQVLSIVYANSQSGTMSGGFFPNGVNGTINTV